MIAHMTDIHPAVTHTGGAVGTFGGIKLYAHHVYVLNQTAQREDTPPEAQQSCVLGGTGGIGHRLHFEQEVLLEQRRPLLIIPDNYIAKNQMQNIPCLSDICFSFWPAE